MAFVALCLLLPAAVNGGPFYHPDTPSYFRAAASAVFRLFDLRTAWIEEYLKVYANNAPPASTAAPTSGESPVTLSGRSSYYGMIIYMAYLAGNVWTAAILQSVVTASSIYLTIQLLARASASAVRPAAALLIGTATALLTPAGYFSGYLMPDLFAGIGLLAACNLLFLWSHMERRESIYWIAILAFSVLAHSTNLMLAAALLVLALAYGWWRKVPFHVWQVASVASCLLAGLLGQFLFTQIVSHFTGASPVRPPFVAMRLIADGPGYDYLQEHCSTEEYIYCRVVGRETRYSDALLWSKEPSVTLFRGLSPSEQRVSAAQQGRFTLAVTLDRPVQVLMSVVRNSLAQLVTLNLRNFNYHRGNIERFEGTVPASLLPDIKQTLAFRRAMPTTLVEATTALVSSASVILLLLLFAGRLRPPEAVRGYVLVLLAGIAVNAAICGALSGPKGRYEMRIIWVLPIVAGVMACIRRRSGLGIGDNDVSAVEHRHHAGVKSI